MGRAIINENEQCISKFAQINALKDPGLQLMYY